MNSEAMSLSLKKIIPAVVEQYMNKCSASWETALECLYMSTLYKELENQEAGLRDLSPVFLCDLLIKECNTGSFSLQEGQHE